VKNKIVVGAQWGDEGKAKITDMLASEADIVIRWQGGCNAGHTVVAGDKTYKFHLIPSGILYKNTICIIGAGTVIYPVALKKEIDELTEQGVDLKNLKIHPLASVTMPYHIDIDGLSESKAQNGEGVKIGTTKKGIGPTYADKINRTGIKIQDLFDEELLSKRLDTILPAKNVILKELYNSKTYTKEEILEFAAQARELIRPYLFEDWQSFYEEAEKSGKKILFEGAQGVMLDIDWGTYPYVTSSNPIGGGAMTGTGFGPNNEAEIVGITKAYITRVGEGPFVTELTDEVGKRIQVIGHEFGVTTGRPRRCGWFDTVVAKYSAQVGGLSALALTKMDVFDAFDEIKICTAYKDKRDGKIYKYYPTNINMHKYLEPVYETMPGWNSNISGVRSYDDLPKDAREYVEKIEKLVGVPVKYISVGPEREQTIFR